MLRMPEQLALSQTWRQENTCPACSVVNTFASRQCYSSSVPGICKWNGLWSPCRTGGLSPDTTVLPNTDHRNASSESFDKLLQLTFQFKMNFKLKPLWRRINQCFKWHWVQCCALLAQYCKARNESWVVAPP